MSLAAAAAAALAALAAGGAGATGTDGATVRFAVKGDWGTGSPAQAAVTRRMCGEWRREPFAFVLTTGDNFSGPDGLATRDTYWRPERCLRSLGVRWRAAWGNDDVRGTSTADVLGSPRRFYAFPAGPARVIVLDANDPSGVAQLSFLRREMSAPPGPVRIVAFHQPLRTAGIRPPDPEQRRLWEPLLRRGRVALVLQGHNHLYERLEVGGITYITTSGGGDRLYPCLRPAEGLRSCRLAHHFLAVRVSARGIDVRAVTPRGVTLERVRIPAAPSRP